MKQLACKYQGHNTDYQLEDWVGLKDCPLHLLEEKGQSLEYSFQLKHPHEHHLHPTENLVLVHSNQCQTVEHHPVDKHRKFMKGCQWQQLKCAILSSYMNAGRHLKHFILFILAKLKIYHLWLFIQNLLFPYSTTQQIKYRHAVYMYSVSCDTL